MSAYQIKKLLFNRMTVVVGLIVVAVRAYQVVTLNLKIFDTTTPSLSNFYFNITTINIAVFILVPLFSVFMLPGVRLLQNDSCAIRLKNRESSVYRYLLLALAKGGLLAFLVNVSGVIILLATCPLALDLMDVALLAFITMALETLFFMICALLVLTVFLLVKNIQIAVIALFCYALWDFLSDHIAFLASLLPVIGWHLTEVSYPVSFFGISEKVLPLIVLVALFVCASVMIVGRKDLVQISEVERDA